jgi:hypothetical protein
LTISFSLQVQEILTVNFEGITNCASALQRVQNYVASGAWEVDAANLMPPIVFSNAALGSFACTDPSGGAPADFVASPPSSSIAPALG